MAFIIASYGTYGLCFITLRLRMTHKFSPPHTVGNAYRQLRRLFNIMLGTLDYSELRLQPNNVRSGSSMVNDYWVRSSKVAKLDKWRPYSTLFQRSGLFCVRAMTTSFSYKPSSRKDACSAF